MKFALVEEVRLEAQPNLKGFCVGCGSPMTAKCGEVRLKHWAHKGRIRCDPWWEPETEWHRSWKNMFPNEWQEVIHHSDSGEKHIADVKTEAGWTLEFQHSTITPIERNSREDFYQRIFWVVDGTRTPQSKSRFFNALENDGFTHRNFSEVRAISSKKVSLLQVWSASNSHVVLDFGDDLLWWLRPESDQNWSYLISINRSQLIDFHHQPNSAELNEFIKKYDEVLSDRGLFPSLTDYYHFKKINHINANLIDE